uniref:Reverse transcriptase domain-containing protein n=1 Tax=Kryptolebias marmoratus TaxID=37003 RepID=A0A3Q3ASU9_KRYMA
MFMYCRNKNPHCILLQETHSTDSDEKFWSNQWGDQITYSHGTTKSAGVAILLNNFPGKIIYTKHDSDGHWSLSVLHIEDSLIILGNIYGYCNISKNKELLTTIEVNVEQLKQRFSTKYVLLGGDWNMVMDEALDRFPNKFANVHPNRTLSDFCNNLGLIDLWRDKHINEKQFSWFKSDASSRSRIDFWLGTDDILKLTSDCSMSPTPLTDHCSINLLITPLPERLRHRGYWKFNANLLKYELYCREIKELVNKILLDDSIITYTKKWEYLKYKIRAYSISFSKNLKRNQDLEEIKLVKELNLLCVKQILTDTDKNNLLTLQAKLDSIYERKAQGAFVRSRAKWTEEGEKNSSYFCRLEKRRQVKNHIQSLIINNNECTDQILIAKEISNFYQNLYCSSFSTQDCDLLLDQVKDFVPQISEDFKEVCDKNISMEELDGAIMCLKLDKSPGPDGLTANFYRHFWVYLREFILQVFKEILCNNSLPHSMKQGVITLIPKPGRDSKVLDNYRPITLLNCDYKLLTYIYTNRLKTGLKDVISETQTGFMSKRSIHNNIRLVQDLLEYSDLVEDKGFILFLDFYKAFDMLEHQFLFKVLQMFGFGPNFCRIIECFYNGTTSSVALPHGTSPRFTINRGVKQGCNISPFLFILAVEVMSIYIKNSKIPKLKVFNHPIIISQLADDTTIFLKNLDQTPKVLELINTFSKASGLTLNLQKCELMAIHDSDLEEAYNIPIKSSVKYLGILITKDAKLSETVNIENKIQNCKSQLNRWLQRDLTLFGRTYLTKMESLSRCIYPAYSMAIPNKHIKAINQLNFNFIWKNRVHYLKKANMVKDFKDGGLQAIDFECLNAVLKVNWLKSFLMNENSIWYCLPRGLFKKIGGIDFVLRCDFGADRLPIKLSAFHKQVLLCWKLMYAHNFTPHQTPIWNNRYVLHRNKSLYLDHWMEKGVWSIRHFLNDNGNWMSYEEFCLLYNLDCSRSQFNTVLNSVPTAVKYLVQNISIQSADLQLPALQLYGVNLLDKSNSNKRLRQHLTNCIFPVRPNKNSILNLFSDSEVNKWRTAYLKYPLSPKAKEVNFKILNNIFPSRELLRQRFNFDTNSCTFCDNDIETTDHLFFFCMHTGTFWGNFQDWISTKLFLSHPLKREDIIFGTTHRDKRTDLILNNLLILAKFFIHSCKWGNRKPNFSAFKNLLMDNHFRTLKLMKNKHGIQLLDAYNEVNLFEN